MLTALVLAAPAWAGDLWLTVEVAEGEQVTLRMPADWLLDDGKPVKLQTDDGAVDLRQEARLLGRRAATWTLRGDDAPVHVTLGPRPAKGAPATQLSLSTLGPLGMGLSLSFPLEADRLGDARAKLDGAIDIEGIELDLDEAACEQLRRSPPTVLLEVTPADGPTFRVATE